MEGLKMSMRHTVILCSRGRPRELEIAVRNLSFQKLSPEMIVIVVTSHQDLSENISLLKETLLEKDIHLEIFISDPGLTKQRNFGLSQVKECSDVVHFFDDDVILPPEYLEIVDSLFQESPEVIGIGGRTTDNSDFNVSFLQRFFLLNSKSAGALLPSGINIGFRYSIEPYEVDWLPGCTMSYRLPTNFKIDFDESREGVGWGEDVDFSSRVSELGKLLVFSHPQIIHTKSAVFRVSDLERSIQNDNSRIKMARSNLGGVKIYWILWSFFGEFVLGTKILKLYFYSFLDLLKQSLISALRLFRILYSFTRSFGKNIILNFRLTNLFRIRVFFSELYVFSINFWKEIIHALKYLNVFNLRISFQKITQSVRNEARIFGLRLLNFYKQLSSSENSTK